MEPVLAMLLESRGILSPSCLANNICATALWQHPHSHPDPDPHPPPAAAAAAAAATIRRIPEAHAALNDKNPQEAIIADKRPKSFRGLGQSELVTAFWTRFVAGRSGLVHCT